MTAPPYSPQQIGAPKATGGLLALGIISIIYACLFRLCCGFASFFGSLARSLVASGAMQNLLNMPGMEQMPDLGAMPPQMQTYNYIKAFVLLILGIAMLAGGIGTIRLRQWARTTLLAVAACEIVWALFDFAISVFFLYPALSQITGDEFGEAPSVAVMAIGGAITLFLKLIFPIILLIYLNVRTVRDQFFHVPGQVNDAF